MRSQSGESVYLLHGMCRNRFSMDILLGRRLRKLGYHVHSFPYLSFLKSIEQHAAKLKRFIEHHQQVDQTESFHLIGHSLGGIISRVYASTYQDSRLKRLVMLAPPNKPPRIAKFFSSWLLYRIFTGRPGQQILDQQFLDRFPLAGEVEVGVIAGSLELANRWLHFHGGKNDGILATEETKATPMQDWIVVASDHTFIMHRYQTFKLAKQFLETGSFSFSN